MNRKCCSSTACFYVVQALNNRNNSNRDFFKFKVLLIKTLLGESDFRFDARRGESIAFVSESFGSAP